MFSEAPSGEIESMPRFCVRECQGFALEGKKHIHLGDDVGDGVRFQDRCRSTGRWAKVDRKKLCY